jgi:hypothetical protein
VAVNPSDHEGTDVLAEWRALRQAAFRWRRCHGDGNENVWDPDRDPEHGGFPHMPPECEARTCGVRHDCRNEYDASIDHLAAVVDAIAEGSLPK